MPVFLKVKCCRRNKKHAAIEKARLALNKEVNIINIITTLRYLKLAMSQVLPKHARVDAKNRSRYVVLDDIIKNKKSEIYRDSEQEHTNISKNPY